MGVLRTDFGVVAGSFEKINDIILNGRFLYFTVLSNNKHPNNIIKIPTTTKNYSQQTRIEEAYLTT